MATDASYKRAVGIFARKKAAFQNRAGVDQIPDLSRETPTSTVTPAPASPAARRTWVDRALQLSAIFSSAPTVERNRQHRAQPLCEDRVTAAFGSAPQAP